MLLLPGILGLESPQGPPRTSLLLSIWSLSLHGLVLEMLEAVELLEDGICWDPVKSEHEQPWGREHFH